MSSKPAFDRAADIEASFERLAEVCGDPTPLVYERLFAAHPTMQPYFWRDTTGAVKGEMLSRTFEAILDFVGERRYAQHMIGTEMVTHEGYLVPRGTFITFFEIIRDTIRETLGEDWTPAFETAWSDMLAQIDTFAQATPRSDTSNPYHAARNAEFIAPYAAKA